MQVVKVNTTKDHILRIGKTQSVNALSELIWNSFDAGATEVNIEIVRNPIGGLEKISIRDNGIGIQKIFVDQYFGDLGKSNKKIGDKNPLGYPVHGKLGEGRFKAYSLGEKLKWISKFQKEQPIQIAADFSEPEHFDVTDYNEVSIPSPGTIFIGENYQTGVNLPDDESLIIKLSEIFAPKLLSEKSLKLKVNQVEVDPTLNIDVEIRFDEKGVDGRSFKGTIVFWKKGKNKEINWCEEGLIPRLTEDLESKIQGYSVFVESPVITKLVKEHTHIIPQAMAPELFYESQAHIKKLLDIHAANKSFETIKELKDKDIYPYDKEPSNDTERLERQVFDVCTMKIVESMPSVTNGSKEAQKLTFTLLKEAIETSPKALKRVLEKVLKLPPSEIIELSNLLDKVSLEGLIKLGKNLNDRLEFIEGFSQLVFESEWKKHVKERKHLQKVLESETWIFGDEFSIGTADQNLENVLKYHLEVLEHSEDEIKEEIETETKQTLIPDIVLGRQFCSRYGDQVEHLVIEIKRPSVKIGHKEKLQIERYATLVSADTRFSKEKTKWFFYVISTDILEEVKPFMEQPGLAYGQIGNLSGGKVKVFIKTWGEVIQDSKGRLAHLKNSLALQPTSEQGMEYLKGKFPKIIEEIETKSDNNLANKK